jgi:hypothetical protein
MATVTSYGFLSKPEFGPLPSACPLAVDGQPLAIYSPVSPLASRPAQTAYAPTCPIDGPCYGAIPVPDGATTPVVGTVVPTGYSTAGPGTLASKLPSDTEVVQQALLAAVSPDPTVPEWQDQHLLDTFRGLFLARCGKPTGFVWFLMAQLPALVKGLHEYCIPDDTLVLSPDLMYQLQMWSLQQRYDPEARECDQGYVFYYDWLYNDLRDCVSSELRVNRWRQRMLTEQPWKRSVRPTMYESKNDEATARRWYKDNVAYLAFQRMPQWWRDDYRRVAYVAD